jgi:hypothetical protein
MGNALMPASHYKLKFSNRQTKLGILIFTKGNTRITKSAGKVYLHATSTHCDSQSHNA